MSGRLRSWMVIATFAAAPLPAQRDMQSLGTVSFASSGSTAARAPFLRGIAALHNFEYRGA